MPVTAAQERPFTLRLRTVFAVILLAMLLLPLSGLYLFRIYEGELVRQTESELIMQGVFLSAAYKQDFARMHGTAKNGIPVREKAPPVDEIYRPYLPQLDLRAAPILPPRPDGKKPDVKPDALAVKIGKRLNPMMEDARLSTLAGLRLLDDHGIVVAGHSDIGLSMAQMPEVDKALHGLYASVLRRRYSDHPYTALASISRSTDIRVFIAMPVIVKDRIVAVAYLSRSPRNVLKALYEEREGFFLAGLFVLCIAGVVIWFLSYAIGSPLGAMTRYAQRLAQGDDGREVLPKPPISEIHSLADSFEKLAEAIELRSTYIRSFAMHVAHEFKTPLTSIQGAIELLHDHPEDMTPEQRLRFMDNIIHDTDRLKKLVTRLLELARADVMKPVNENTDVAALMTDIGQKYGEKVSFAAAPGLPPARIGADILETALLNLVQNSLQHGASRVDISATIEDGALRIDLQDDGAGISEANTKKLFTPFFTTTRENGGTGLGLVITRALLRAHDGEIAHVPGGKGALFRITLPVAG
ncbi:MAG: HAMP domain-containing protein [Alphaproteobacteria bacterium]|nr:HAMP domain-containing protein [Alphaproteobacteria bacterium]